VENGAFRLSVILRFSTQKLIRLMHNEKLSFNNY